MLRFGSVLVQRHAQNYCRQHFTASWNYIVLDKIRWKLEGSRAPDPERLEKMPLLDTLERLSAAPISLVAECTRSFSILLSFDTRTYCIYLGVGVLVCWYVLLHVVA